jgi:hypothetical protein
MRRKRALRLALQRENERDRVVLPHQGAIAITVEEGAIPSSREQVCADRSSFSRSRRGFTQTLGEKSVSFTSPLF